MPEMTRRLRLWSDRRWKCGLSLTAALVLLCLTGKQPFFAAMKATSQARSDSAPDQSGGVQFKYGGNVAQIPAQVVDSLVLVPVRVNGSQPSWFLLDTSRSASAIDDVRAVAVGLYSPSPQNELPRSFVNVSLELPGLRIALPTLGLGSFSDLSARIGHAVQGVLGADVLSRLIIKIDYDGRAVRFYDPRNFQYKGRGVELPIEVSRGTPEISGRIAINHRGNFRGNFAITTGQTEALRFSSRFAVEHSLFDLPERMLPFSSADDPNDTDPRDRIGRVHAIQFGKITFANPIAIFPGETLQGTLGEPQQVIAKLGGKILNRFTVFLDYPAQLMFLEPNRRFSEVFAEDMSGLTIIAIPPTFQRFEVARVAANSPAAEARIEVGDMIVQADGDLVSGDTLDQLKTLLREAGTSHTLTLLRDGKQLKVTLALKPLI